MTQIFQIIIFFPFDQFSLQLQYIWIIIVKMRKYLKGKDAADANSTVFQEAKRRFHYEPPQKENKYFLHGKHKAQNTNSNRQFKDDFSSVKQAKNDTNQINESSWIVKLVNVMHENSEEDKQSPQNEQQANNFLSLRPIESKEFQQIPKEQIKAPLPVLKQPSKDATPLATKKNSVNTEMIKKRSKSQISQNCDTVSKQSKKHSKASTIKRNKNQVDLKRNKSQSLIKTSDKKQEKRNSEIKSSKNISYSKAHTQKVRIENNSALSDKNVYSSKHFSGNLGIQSKNSSQINKQIQIHKDFISLNSKDKIAMPQEQHFQSSICYQEVKDNIFDDGIPEDLFALSTNQKSLGAKTQTQQTTEKRSYIGSIKKNKPTNLSQRKDLAAPKQPQYQSKEPFKRQQAIIFDKKDEDIVTAREQKHLIDKYLNNDYSFKKQSNMFRNDYSTSDFDRSLSHLNKPSINLERPTYSGKTSYRHESYMSKKEQREPILVERPDEKLVSRRQPMKKFNYFSDNGEKQTTENSMSVEILTLRCHQEQPKPIIEPLPTFTRPVRNEHLDVNQRQTDQTRYKKQEQLRRIHQKYNYQLNKQNQSRIETRKNSVIIPATRRENLMEVKPNVINRNPYLQQSTYKNEDHWSVEAKNSVGFNECPTFKIDQNHPVVNRQRVQSNFNIDNLNSISRRERTDSEIYSEAQSENLITRLNSKLHSYINQHHLEKQTELPLSSREAEPTHRRMNLNFNQLKKHHDFFQR